MSGYELQPVRGRSLFSFWPFVFIHDRHHARPENLLVFLFLSSQWDDFSCKPLCDQVTKWTELLTRQTTKQIANQTRKQRTYHAPDDLSSHSTLSPFCITTSQASNSHHSSSHGMNPRRLQYRPMRSCLYWHGNLHFVPAIVSTITSMLYALGYNVEMKARICSGHHYLCLSKEIPCAWLYISFKTILFVFALDIYASSNIALYKRASNDCFAPICAFCAYVCMRKVGCLSIEYETTFKRCYLHNTATTDSVLIWRVCVRSVKP